jgi:hypothetical protein
MIIIGIDPGLDGGIAILRWPAALETRPMPTVKDGKRRSVDTVALAAALRLDADIRVYLEKVWAMPVAGRRQGAGSMFSFGRTFGAAEGVIAALGHRLSLVPPQRWQRAVLSGKGTELADAARQFPGHDFRASPRCRKPHGGMVDAALIALYGMQRWTKEGNSGTA